MAKTICIFGNSHISAPATSQHNALFRERGDEIYYWGLAGSSFPKFSYDNGRIISPFPHHTLSLSKWCEHLDIRLIDVLVCYGFHISPSTQARNMAHALQKSSGISSEMRRAFSAEMMDTWWQQQTARHLIERISKDFPNKRMIFYSHPHVAEHSTFFRSIGDDDLIRACLDDVLTFLEKRMTDLGVEYRPQPAETVIEQIYTAGRYNGGGIKWETDSGIHGPEDDRHMNALYGDCILGDLADLIYR